MTNQIDSLIWEFEGTGEGTADLWNRVNKFAHKQGWYENERLSLNEYLIDESFRLGDKNILLAVALSLVPEGMAWKLENWPSSGYSAKIFDCGKPYRLGMAQEQGSLALALCVAALKARASA